MPVVPTGLPLDYGVFVRATEARKRQYADVVDWAEAKHRVLTDDGQVRLIQFQPPQRAVLRYQFQRTTDGHLRFRTMVYSTIKKSGKALALDTPIPISGGWAPLGEVKVGDTLFDEHRNPCRVTFKTGIMLDHPCYRVSFSDGSSIVADAEHQWAVEGGTHGVRLGLTTAQLADFALPWQLESHHLPGTGRRITGAVPVLSVPVACIQVNSPSHLYLAGATGVPTHNTEVGGIVGRYAAEELDPYAEVYAVANDRDQAMERTYAAIRRSYELTPGYDRKNRLIPGLVRLTDVEAKVLMNNAVIRTVSLDAKGEAGANPVCSVWSEVWGFDNKPALLLWDEMTPALTRSNSFRFVESYAGIDPDSELLLRLYVQGVNEGRQITAGELADVTGEAIDVFAECRSPDDLVPIWVNDDAALVVYWDSGPLARRMPWQKGERAEAYYRTEAESLTPESYHRVHLNEWVGSTSAFVDAAWWNACQDPRIPPLVRGSVKPELVLAVDGAVSGDCTALVAVSRHPVLRDDVVVRYAKAWTPPPGGKLDYALTIGPELDRLCQDYNVLTVVYDPYQMHDLMTQERKKGLSRILEFSQGKQRMEADKLLYDLIKGRRLHWNAEIAGPDLSTHVANSASKQGKQEDTKLRIIKKSEKLKIDLAVTLSMAGYECLRLYLDPTGEAWSA